MRQADINRVMKAKEKLQAAFGKLCDIKWENISGLEDNLRSKAKESLITADRYLDDLININKD